MPYLSRRAAAALALLPALAVAQPNTLQADPLDPAHPVQEAAYQSVFDRTPYTLDEKETPQARWLRANQQLMPGEKPAGQPSTPPPAPPASDPHLDAHPHAHPHAHRHGGH